MMTKSRTKYITVSIAICLWMAAMSLCGYAKERTYRGKVVDFDTKEPIEGAVVVAHWYKAWQTVAGESTSPKEVKECLTDKNGNWSIVGLRGKADDPYPYLSFFLGLSYIREPSFIIFKPGYCSWPKGFYIDACKGSIEPRGTAEIMEGKDVELLKLTSREDRLSASRLSPIYSDSGDRATERSFLKKQREFLRLLNEEDKNMGLYENRTYKEIVDEK
jgi:hypothetical protein